MNILLVRPDGIGDEILCLPVATALRQVKPQARVIFLSSQYAAPVLEHHQDVDEIWTLSGRESLRDLVGLFQRGVDAAIFLKPFRLMLAAWLARVPIRVATGYRWYSVLANRRIYEHRSDFSKHETAYNVGMLKGLGLDPPAPVPPKLVITEEERRTAGTRLQVPAPRVVLHPGGFAARRWRTEQYWKLPKPYEAAGSVSCSPVALRRRSISFGYCQSSLRFRRESSASWARHYGNQWQSSQQPGTSGATGPAHIAAACGVLNISLLILVATTCRRDGNR